MVLAFGLSAACYSPSIKDGSFTCGDGGACPSGFACRLSDHLCWKNVAGDAGSDGDMICQSDAHPACVSQTTTACDPYCQTGCPCTEKCSVPFASPGGAVACVPGLGTRKAMQSCTISDVGTAQQNDNCEPGTICISPGGPGATSTSFCFALCRTSADCSGGVPCTFRDVGTSTTPTNVKVCDPPYVTCDPINNKDCPADRPHCYVADPDAQGNSRTLCEFVHGTKGIGDTCAAARECFDTFACPQQPLQGGGTCHPTCDANHSCTQPSTCNMGLGTPYGYCNPPQ